MIDTTYLVTITYFCANIILLLLLGYYAKKQGENELIASNSFCRDIFIQHKIYAPLIVHFFDTATDIGIIIYWYGLMIDETQNDIDYLSVNMKIFFWLGLTFLIFWRVLTLFGVLLDLIGVMHALYANWYDLILVLMDVYIHKAAYTSLELAYEKMVENAKKEKEQQSDTQKAMELQVETNQVNNINEDDIDDEDAAWADDKEGEIKPDTAQYFIQVGESVTEAIPSIMLQSVFVIRSYNDPSIRNHDLFLISLSILASLFSITNKYVILDEGTFEDGSRSLVMTESNNCINHWYILRVLWRICDITSKYCVYVLIWTVLGGAFLPIYAFIIFILWSIYLGIREEDSNAILACLWGIISLGGSFVGSRGVNTIRFIESIIGFGTVAIFALIDFECGPCASSESRKFSNESNNNRILSFFIMGCVAAVLELILYLILRIGDMTKH